MRAGVNTVQQTLTPEAANILMQAVSEARRRGHAQATPVHVAATLLASPNSPLRRACLQTHPHSSQLPQCRALELCFNIALDQLQAAQGPLPNGQPSYSNALVAALKRAQAHQRRGCPEQQQQPLLAVKVELEQLIISILDDPRVSRVMREAGFNSTDVKSHLEEIASHHASPLVIPDTIRLPLGVTPIDQMGFPLGVVRPSLLGGFSLPHHINRFSNGAATQERTDLQHHMRPFRITPSPYMNPILLKPGSAIPSVTCEESNQVLEVFLRKKSRNPLLMGDSAARVDDIVKDVIQRLERGTGPEQLHGVKVISANLSCMTLINASKEDLCSRFAELNKSVQELICSGGVVIHMGNLQWLEKQVRSTGSQTAGFHPVQHAASEMKELLARHRDCNRVWLMASATNHTYQNCQSLYTSFESQWDFCPISIGASRISTLSTARCSSQGTGVDSLTLSLLPSSGASSQPKVPSEDDGQKLTCCADCSKKYERDAALLQEQECPKHPESPQSCSSSIESPSKAIADQSLQPSVGSQPALPLWLQKALPAGSSSIATTTNEVREKTPSFNMRLQELRKKWNRTCRSLHSDHLPSWSESIEVSQQQPSPLSSQVSGNPSERTLSLLRERSIAPKPILETLTSLSGHHPSSNVMPLNAKIPGIQSTKTHQLLQARAHNERVHENNNCSPSMLRLSWQTPHSAMPMMRSTEAAVPCSTSESVTQCQPSRTLLRMNPELLGQLCKSLAKKVSWQPKIISSIASTVVQCRAGLSKRAGGLSLRGDTWLLFLGYDRPGKRLMAEALAECSFGDNKKPICMSFGKQQDVSSPDTWNLGLNVPSRGKMPLDQLAEAVRHNPSSLLYLEDLEQADSIFRSSLTRAMSKGRLVDSSGREVSFNSVIVVMTSSVGTCSEVSTTSVCGTQNRNDCSQQHNEDHGSYLQASHELNQANKRKPSWNVHGDSDENESSKLHKRSNCGRGLDLDLNMAAEDNDKAPVFTSHVPTQDACSVTGNTKPDLSDEDVLRGARIQLGEFCDLVDAAVVFASPV